MDELVLVKLGGSLITDKSKPFTERLDVIKGLAKEIHEARVEQSIKLIIGHGGGSYPHQPAHEYQTHKGVKDERGYEGIAKVQDAAARLNRILVKEMIEAGQNAVSIQPSASYTTEDSRITEWYTKPIERLLEYKMLPVVYGDVGFDLAKGSCIISTEEIFRFLSTKFGVAKIIMCGKVDGVLDSENKVIPEITESNFEEIKKHLQGSDATDVTGGMVHKIEQSLEIAKNGPTIQIINGLKPNLLKDALLGKEVLGTVIRK